MSSRSLILVAVALGVAACNESAPSLAPENVEVAPASLAANEREGGRFSIVMLDNCASDGSFNTSGGCTINGTVSRQAFTAAVLATGGHPDWRNDPTNLEVQPNSKLNVINAGGRPHTFTRVAAFGGGIIPILNVLPGTNVVAPECRTGIDRVEGGGSREMRTGHSAGGHDEHYQCCYHPWMRTTIHVKHKAH